MGWLTVGLFSIFFIAQVSAIQLLSNDEEIHNFRSTNNITLIGYVKSECQFTDEFKDQMQVMYDELAARDINVNIAIANGNTTLSSNPRTPYVSLNRLREREIKFNYISDGKRLAREVYFKLKGSAIYEVKTKAQIDNFLKDHQTVFVAYFDDNRDLDTYKQIAEDNPAIYLFTQDKDFAFNKLNFTSSDVIAEHPLVGYSKTNFGEKNFNRDHLQGWIARQSQEVVQELNPIIAGTVFGSNRKNIAIMFIRKSHPNFTQFIEEFDRRTRAVPEISKYFADLDNNGKSLASYFDVSDYSKPTIVLLEKYEELEHIPFTKQCSSSDHKQLPDLMKKFTGEKNL